MSLHPCRAAGECVQDSAVAVAVGLPRAAALSVSHVGTMPTWEPRGPGLGQRAAAAVAFAQKVVVVVDCLAARRPQRGGRFLKQVIGGILRYELGPRPVALE